MNSGKYYLTTPIYYVNAAPHIGHAYTTIAAEAIARYKRMQGFDVVLTSGTDEHGTKVERAATAQGKTPEAFADLISEEFRSQWQKLDLRIDRFQRTTAANHARLVNQLFEACKSNGYIYKGTYTGLYAVVSESFVNDAKPGDIDPETGKPYEEVTEENYFFKLSAFTDRLLQFYEANPHFIQPEIRRNEVLAFVKQGLADLSITRTSIKWGIPVDSDPSHVFYVWFDALMTYISAVEGLDRWPADLHLIGKEILRFHAVYWPAFLLAAGWELPKQIFAHGWLLFENDKMSKSRGNIVRPAPDCRDDGRGCAAVFPSARDCLRTGWQLFLRCAGGALQLRFGEWVGQSCEQNAQHDSAVPRRRNSTGGRRPCHCRRNGQGDHGCPGGV